MINNEMMNVNAKSAAVDTICGKRYDNLIEANRVIYLPIDGHCHVVGFNIDGGVAVIAKTVDGMPVTAVRNGRYFRTGHYPNLIFAPDTLLKTWWGAYWHPYYEENSMFYVDYYNSSSGDIVARNRTDDFWLKEGRLLHSVRSATGDIVTIPSKTIHGSTDFDPEACMEFWEKYPSKVLCPARLADKAAEKFGWAKIIMAD